MFALYVKLPKKGIPNDIFTDKTEHKLYLSGLISNDNTNTTCNLSNGMFKLTNVMTKGSIFNLTPVTRNIPIPNTPYKYLDFYNVTFNKISESKMLHSIFYNLRLNYNNYSLTYCLRNCDVNNPSGLCAQELINNNDNSSLFMENNIETDTFQLKNLMKFKFESDGSVTPYFLSYSNNKEKIYFITNKYSTVDDDDGYKALVQVPIYGKTGPYYEIPDIIVQNSINFPTVRDDPIDGLNPLYTELETSQYYERASLLPEETKAFLNDAYTKYALNFFVEEIDPTVTDINKLPLNE
jgi:hypothetical protein